MKSRPSAAETRALYSGALVGCRVEIRIAPPIALRPYSAPCGPRSTSTLSMSNSSCVVSRLFVALTPSIRNDTGGWPVPRFWRTPRMTSVLTPTSWSSEKRRFGVKDATRLMRSIR